MGDTNYSLSNAEDLLDEGVGVVYIAGPMRGFVDYNFPAFHAAAKRCRDYGFDVVNPAEIDEGNGFDPKTDEAKTIAYYMSQDLPEVLACDAVVVLPGWTASQGARIETAVFAECKGAERVLDLDFDPVFAERETLAPGCDRLVPDEVETYLVDDDPAFHGVPLPPTTTAPAAAECCGDPGDCSGCRLFVGVDTATDGGGTAVFAKPCKPTGVLFIDEVAHWTPADVERIRERLGIVEAAPDDDVFVLDPERGEAVPISEEIVEHVETQAKTDDAAGAGPFAADFAAASADLEAGRTTTLDDLVADLTSNPTNPKDAIGSDKLPFHLWPETATAYGCLGLLDGALKYGRSNFRETGVRATIYVDALRRHVGAWAEGEDLDPDSGLPHLAHALACLAIVVDAEAAGKLTDDRQYPGGFRKLVDRLTPHVARLKALHAERRPYHWTIGDAR